MTDGLEVLVQLVMAEITTEPGEGGHIMHKHKLHTCALPYRLGPPAAVIVKIQIHRLSPEFILLRFHCSPQLIHMHLL